MNLPYFLNSKGYSARTIMVNGQFNIQVLKGDKGILRVTVNPNSFPNKMEFDKELFNIVKEQITIYEEELNEANRESQGCQEVHCTSEESN